MAKLKQGEYVLKQGEFAVKCKQYIKSGFAVFHEGKNYVGKKDDSEKYIVTCVINGSRLVFDIEGFNKHFVIV